MPRKEGMLKVGCLGLAERARAAFKEKEAPELALDVF
jgi:hypothetical protein